MITGIHLVRSSWWKSCGCTSRAAVWHHRIHLQGRGLFPSFMGADAATLSELHCFTQPPPPPPLDSVMISSANKILEAKGMIYSNLCIKFCWHHSCLHDHHSENKKTALQDHGEDGQEFTPTQCSRAQSYIAALQPIRGPANLGVTLLLAASKRW